MTTDDTRNALDKLWARLALLLTPEELAEQQKLYRADAATDSRRSRQRQRERQQEQRTRRQRTDDLA